MPVLPALPRPDVHVRWAAPLIQPKRNSSSIPGDRGEVVAKNSRGKSQAPPPPHAVFGCYGSCARCNQCYQCRMRKCNGTCTGCRKCVKCREWGRRLAENESVAVATQAEQEILPEVVKRKASDPGNIAKQAAAAKVAAARPKSAAPGSKLCPY